MIAQAREARVGQLQELKERVATLTDQLNAERQRASGLAHDLEKATAGHAAEVRRLSAVAAAEKQRLLAEHEREVESLNAQIAVSVAWER